jgi:hypothetical protein
LTRGEIVEIRAAVDYDSTVERPHPQPRASLRRPFTQEFVPMTDTATLGFNDTQREILLQGLRYVSSSLRLDPRDPDPELDADRDRQLSEINTLVDQLSGRATAAV